MNLRHTILVRTDLNMPLGLLAAQVAHIHSLPFTQCVDDEKFKEWVKDPYLSIHGIAFIEALEYFIEQAKRREVRVIPWRDTIYTSLAPNMRVALPDVLVGVSLGPDDSDVIKSVIGDLPLL